MTQILHILLKYERRVYMCNKYTYGAYSNKGNNYVKF